MFAGALEGLRTRGPSALRCFRRSGFRGRLRRPLVSSIARSSRCADLAGAALDQRRGDFGFRLGAGARCLFLGFDGALAGGDEAIDGAQRCLVEAAGAGRRNGTRLSGGAAAAIRADDTLLGDDTLGGHGRGAVGVKGGRRLAEHFDENCRPPLDAVQGEATVILGQPVDDDCLLGSMRGGLVKQLDVQLGLTDMHFGRAAVVVLRGAVRLHLEHRFRLVLPFDQSVRCASEATLGQHQPLLLSAGMEEARFGAREAGGEIGGAPMLEGVAAVEDAVGVMSLTGDAVLVVPEPARAPACLRGIDKVGAIVTCSDAGREWPGCRLAAARLDDHLPEGVQSYHDAPRHSSVRPSCLRRRARITASSMEWRTVGHETSTGLRWPMRTARATGWRLVPGVQLGSSMMMRLAACRLSAEPAASICRIAASTLPS